MRKVLIVIAVAAVVLSVGGYFAGPVAWAVYERATNPLPKPYPARRYDPDFEKRSTADWLRTCTPSFDPYDGMALDSNCVVNFAERPEDAALLTPRLNEFLRSPNSLDVARAALILGWFDERLAAPEIARLLRSTDWRVVQAAARTLGWLGARDALPELDRTAREHWLPQVRIAATASANAIRTRGALRRPASLKGDGGFWSELWFQLAEPVATCPGDAYRWKGRPIRLGAGAAEITVARGDRRNYNRLTLVRPSGRLVGSDAGEWGGGLLWRPWLSRATILHDRNTFGLANGNNAIMGLFGSRHMLAYAYAAEVINGDGGEPRLGQPIMFAGNAWDLSAVGAGLFAVRTDAGVLVFDSDRILGRAECAF